MSSWMKEKRVKVLPVKVLTCNVMRARSSKAKAKEGWRETMDGVRRRSKEMDMCVLVRDRALCLMDRVDAEAKGLSLEDFSHPPFSFSSVMSVEKCKDFSVDFLRRRSSSLSSCIASIAVKGRSDGPAVDVNCALE